jgi:hypothetical protein
MNRFLGKYCALTVTLAVATGAYASHAYGQWGCAIIPVLEYDGGTMYYADLYETSCDDNPEPTYIFGDYDYPQICPNCETGSQLVSNRFQGLPAPISEAFVLQLPEGPARNHSELVDFQGPKFIQIEDVKGDFITAKVFAFKVYKRRLLQKPGPDEGRLIVIAMQVASTPGEEPVMLRSKPVDEVGACFAYSAVYEDGNRPIPLLVLTAK